MSKPNEWRRTNERLDATDEAVAGLRSDMQDGLETLKEQWDKYMVGVIQRIDDLEEWKKVQDGYENARMNIAAAEREARAAERESKEAIAGQSWHNRILMALRRKAGK